MVVVYLKNGEKAPIPDANYVKLEGAGEGAPGQVLRCFFGNTEVGYFRWDEVAGYTLSSLRVTNQGAPDAWLSRTETQQV
jgi:hypothetical protein